MHLWIAWSVCLSGLSARRVKPYHGVFARLHGVALQETDHEHLHDQDSVAHPDAVARAEPERHECIWVHLLPAVFTEPAQRQEDRYSLNHKINATKAELSLKCYA